MSNANPNQQKGQKGQQDQEPKKGPEHQKDDIRNQKDKRVQDTHQDQREKQSTR